MENLENSIEALRARQEELAKKITLLDAAGERNDEWNKLNNEYEEIGLRIAEQEKGQEQIAA